MRAFYFVTRSLAAGVLASIVTDTFTKAFAVLLCTSIILASTDGLAES